MRKPFRLSLVISNCIVSRGLSEVGLCYRVLPVSRGHNSIGWLRSRLSLRSVGSYLGTYLRTNGYLYLFAWSLDVF